MPEHRRLIIIGSGPAGYTAAIYTARAQLHPLLIASAVDAGGELTKTTEVENFPGFPDGVMGPDLMNKMREQAERFGTDVVYDDVLSLALGDPIKEMTLGGGDRYGADAVIFATGSAYRKLNIPREKELTGHGVSWCATCDGFFFKDQVVAVVGGGDSAMEEALFLSRLASKVYVVHRGTTLRASRIMQDRALSNDKIEFIWESAVGELVGDDELEAIDVRSTASGDVQRLNVDGLFIAIGNDPRTHLVHNQLDLTELGTVKVEGRSSRTGIPGVFAAGDVVDPHYRQAVTAAASGAIAALDAEQYLSALHP